MVKEIQGEVWRHLGCFVGVLRRWLVKVLGYVVSVWIVCAGIGIGIVMPMHLNAVLNSE